MKGEIESGDDENRLRQEPAAVVLKELDVRDDIFEEDSTRSKNVNLNANLAILRGASSL